MERFSDSAVWKYIPVICLLLIIYCLYMQISNTNSLRGSLASQRGEVQQLTVTVNKALHLQELEGKRRVRDVNRANDRIDFLMNAVLECKGFNSAYPPFIYPYRNNLENKIKSHKKRKANKKNAKLDKKSTK